VVTGKEVVKLLRLHGWELDRVVGSHHIMAKGDEVVPVPVHGKKELKKGTLHSILKKAGIR
jgi:predicted RNA binding protein YcfA (HicA-like mRNA interferase family)